MDTSVGRPPVNGQDSPEGRHMPEPDKDWGAITLAFCPQPGLAWEGVLWGTRARLIVTPPGSPHLRPPHFPSDCSHLNLGGRGRVQEATLKLWD